MAIDKAVDSTILNGYFTNIASAIRTKAGTAKTLTPAEMPQAINDIPSGGGGTDFLALKINGVYDDAFDYYSEAPTSIAYQALYNDQIILSLTLPNVTLAGNQGCYGATRLQSVKLDACKSVVDCFRNCTALKTADMGLTAVYSQWNQGSIGSNGFNGCTALDTLILRHSWVLPLQSIYSLYNTPINSGNGYIYVPSSLIESYKTATNWTTVSAQFRALEDYTVDGTISGELDSSKI